MTDPHPQPAAAHADLPIVQVERVDSTMRLARESLRDGRRGPFLVISAEQTCGYGTRGRSWQSPLGGLWCTAVWPLTSREIRPMLSLAAGLACLRTISKVLNSPTDIRLKWPNDILIHGRKVCGILCETITHDETPYALIGIGMNINNSARDLAPDLRRPATSLHEESSRAIDLIQVRTILSGELAAALGAGSARPILQSVAPNLWRLDESILIRFPSGESKDAKLRGLTMNGRPLIELDGHRAPLPEGAEILDPEPTS